MPPRTARTVPSAKSVTPSVSPRAARLHASSLVIDTHIDTATHLLYRDPDFGARLKEGHVDIPRMREGGVDAAFFAVWIDEIYDEAAAFKYAVREIDVIHRTIEKHPDDLALAVNATDIEKARAEGKIAVLISIEGGRAVADDMGCLRALHRLGVRSITLAWYRSTNWCDSHNENRHGGLTPFGRDVVREMNHLGMLVDISHVSDSAFWDVLETSEKPVFASHSCCRALCDHTRNMTDEMIRALAEKDGVMNVTFVSGFVAGKPSSDFRPPVIPPREKLRDPFDYIGWPCPEPGPPFASLMAQFNHAITLAGPGHVGIGSDYDGTTQTPQGVEDISKLPRVTEGLLASGHSEVAVRGILGLNNMRLFRKTLR
ncbi:MAG: membrane dipeptidase [Dehalococcoidia bacterium]|nr:membrane dipeptidase [Dehalococcoidia bacterium]